MFSVGLSVFSPSPWNERVRDVMFNALSKEVNINCEKIINYPEKKYDILILCGIRVISKKSLDINRLRDKAKILIEIGDDGIDPQRTYEDYYFYFIPTSTPKYKHYIYLPKFVDENFLYPEQPERVTVFVDHFKCQTESERQISIKSLLYIFENLKKYRTDIDIYFHSSKGIELNPEQITIPSNKKSDFKFIDYSEITKIYRKCHIYFPTHRETQGMLAQEIGACGGLTIMQEWMYPYETHHQFEHKLYNFNYFVDFDSILKDCKKKEFIKKNRDRVIENCSVSLFNKVFKNKIYQILENKFKVI